MHFTPIRFVTCVLAVPLALVIATGACGQVTGLSNDYVYDLQEDAGASGDAKIDTGPGSTDAAKSDAPADAPSGMDAATCSTAQASSTQLRLTQLGGTMACKDCLSRGCCTAVDSCMMSSECRRALSCRLDCTALTNPVDRHDCFNMCNNGGGGGGNTTPPSYTNGVGACSASNCSATTSCGF